MIKCLKLLNNNVETQSAELLIKNNLTLSVAESCTGGLLSSLMTDISGSSSYTTINFVTYANKSKSKYLKVKEETLYSHGAVSIETATEMVQGLLSETGCDIALATTGIAGPAGGTAEKPVGLVYIGVGSSEKIIIHKFSINPRLPRTLIKFLFAKQAVKLLNKFLKEYK